MMKFIKLFFLIHCSISFTGLVNAQTKTDSLLTALNTAIANKDVYVNKKLQVITYLKQKTAVSKTLQQKYTTYSLLYEQYKLFSYDSSYNYAKKLQAISLQLNDPFLIASAKMKLSFTLLSSGLFKETLDELNSISTISFPVNSKVEFYFLKARCYFDLSDYNRSPDYTAIYNPAGIKCIDSALVLCNPGTLNFLQLKGLRDLRIHEFEDGKIIYTSLLKLPNLSPHDFAVNASCLSYIYGLDGQQETALNLLTEAAISDIKSATKETVAIFKLADVQYQKGDIKNAYAFIKQAMDDATFYGALQRQVQISRILPIIEAQWIHQIEYQKKLLYIYAFIITLLVIFVVAFAVIIFRQLKKLRIADELIKSANISLNENNLAQKELIKNLSTANKIKNEYISYYFNINSVYIEKLESFQKSIDKKLSSKRYDDALHAVKNLNLENERLQLFHTFDKIFLGLFPEFINKFNSLFNDNEEIIIPEGQLLSTEHRIFALIRMGIHDPDRIAKLLGYSLNTIYSYKNRIKNKSFVANDEFEDRVMDIEPV
ncbi:MAG: DUF6377 domain-containing protein [Bacteroidota bacterium]|nr:DUF6377 domain-containing protein [Bacteroidota bacterium]